MKITTEGFYVWQKEFNRIDAQSSKPHETM